MSTHIHTMTWILNTHTPIDNPIWSFMAFQPRTTSLACACALFIRIEFKFDAWNPSINSTVLSCSLSLSKSLDAYVCHCQRINFNGIWSEIWELNQYSGYIIFGGKVFDLIRFEMRNRNAKTAEIRIIWANYHMNGSSCCCCCFFLRGLEIHSAIGAYPWHGLFVCFDQNR